MPRRTILTQLTDPTGASLALYREADQYGVATLSSHRRLIPLAAARYPTYAAAHDRLEQEWRVRRALQGPRTH